MAVQQLEAKYIDHAQLRDLLTRLFGAGRFRINVSQGPGVLISRLMESRQTADDNYILHVPRRLTPVEHIPSHRLHVFAYQKWLGRRRICSKEIVECFFSTELKLLAVVFPRFLAETSSTSCFLLSQCHDCDRSSNMQE
jgi:hypothetical protein